MGNICANRAHFAFLEKAHELRLHLQREIRNFIDEKDAAIGLLNQAFSVLGCAGEGAFLVAKEFAFKQMLGNGTTINGDKRPGIATAELMDGPGDQFLASAAFTFKHNPHITAGGSLREVDLGVRLKDSRLRLEHTSAEGSIPGSLDLTLTLEPEAGGYRLYTRFRGEGLKFPDLTPDQDLRKAIPVAFDLELAGFGTSPHAIVSRADGYLIATLGEGRIDSNPVNLMMDKLPGGRLFAQLLGTFNPTWDLTPYTTVKCGVIVAAIEDGVVEVDPLVARTPALRVVAHGQLDLETEELDFGWVTKPKRLTASLVSITDDFIKLGGTLTEPVVEAKPLEAMTATGVGVATAGASVVAESLWKSVSSWRICKRALKKAKKAREARRLRATAQSPRARTTPPTG